MNNWDDIRYFLSVARCGSLSTAAKELGVNHSTVSRRIQALEERHGVRLFERLPSGYEMNVAASSIFELALELEAKNQQVNRHLFGQDSRLQGEINLTMPHDIFDYCLSKDLAEFKQLQPDILLNLYMAKGVKNLAAREADIAIRLTAEPPEYLIGKKVAHLQHGIYCHSQLDLSAQVGIIVWNGESSLPSWAQQFYPKAKVTLRVDDLYSMYAAVKAGIGIARMPCYLPDILSEVQVKRLPIELPLSKWGVWVLSHVDLRNTAKVRCCREFLTERLQQRKSLFEGDESQYKN
jgi:DNA-binding transcriptional LysR family regulator